jgi:hypothetical protein
LTITVDRPPVVTTSNINPFPNQTLAASSLFNVFDPNGYSITEYQFWDTTDGAASGHFYLNGSMVAPHTLIDVSASQLGQVTFVIGTVSNLLEARAFDGVSWSASWSDAWAPFSVNIASGASAAQAQTVAAGGGKCDRRLFR